MTLSGTCTIVCTTLVLIIAIIIQLLLTFTNLTLSQFALKSIITYSTYRARSLYQLPQSDDDFFKHNYCIDPWTNQTASCEMVGMNLFFSFIIPDWEYIATSEPESFINRIRNPLQNDMMFANPSGTVYEFNKIFNLRSVLVHSDLHHRDDRAVIFHKGCIVFFHDGGYVSGSTLTRLKFLSYLHLSTGIPILGVDYRLAPEYPVYDAPFLEDADFIITEYLHNKYNIPYADIFVVGTSAGGGISVAVMQYFSQKSIQLGGGVFISPSINWTRSAFDALNNVNHQYDVMLSSHYMTLSRQYMFGCRDQNGVYVEGGIDYSNIEECIALGIDKLERKHLNPISNDWSKLAGSNMLWIASKYELLKDHSIWGHDKALENEVHSTLIVIPNSSLHVLPVFVDIPEAKRVIGDIAHELRTWKGLSRVSGGKTVN